MAKFTPISGFPEWTPAERLTEKRIIHSIERRFELYGFASIETRSIEPLDVLLSKGDDKEIYVIKRLHADPDAQGGQDEGAVGLHFDLTVPFARYVLEFQHALSFPFKRYQIQKVWRGERKQEGRYREFYQCDVDIIGQGSLPLAYDIELPRLLYEVINELPIPNAVIKINNRKVLEGVYRGLGIEDIEGTLRVVDKLAKIGPDEVLAQLQVQCSLTQKAAQACLALGQIHGHDATFVEKVKALQVEHPLLDEGLEELCAVLNGCKDLPSGAVEVDLSIARGLNYYTGTVYEGYMVGHEHIGAVCSGGRYDNLAKGGRQPLPGIGVSIGITRILGYLFGRKLLTPVKGTPVDVMVILPDEVSRDAAFAVAQTLRRRGISTDVYHLPQNFGKQMKAAEKRGVRYVLFMGNSDGESHQIKDLVSGDQYEIDIEQWLPETDVSHFNLKGAK